MLRRRTRPKRSGILFDMDADQGAATRAAIIERAESEDAIMAICRHGGFGRVVRAEGRRYWQPVSQFGVS